MTGALFEMVSVGEAPLAAVALHDGHEVRPELLPRLALSETERFREEDPFTRDLTRVAPHQVIVHRSRFEVDLDRPREHCVYQTPDEARGLKVWRQPLTPGLLLGSLHQYDDFYQAMDLFLLQLERRWGRFVVFDLHSCHHGGVPTEHWPEIGVHTGSPDRLRWRAVIDRFRDALRSCDVLGRPIRVRENGASNGGHFAHWVHERFPRSACVLAIELGNLLRDEWTGECQAGVLQEIHEALEVGAAGVLKVLRAQGKCLGIG